MHGEAHVRRRLNPSKRKQLLMKDAISVFALRGIGRAGHTEIAQRAGVSVATVFNYFNTREALVDEVLDEVENYLINLSVSAVDKPGSAAEVLDHCITTIIQACKTYPDYFKIWLEWSSSVREDTWPRYLTFQNQMMSLIETQIQNAVNDGRLAPRLPVHARDRWAFGEAPMRQKRHSVSDAEDESAIRELISRGFSHTLGVSPA